VWVIRRCGVQGAPQTAQVGGTPSRWGCRLHQNPTTRPPSGARGAVVPNPPSRMPKPSPYGGAEWRVYAARAAAKCEYSRTEAARTTRVRARVRRCAMRGVIAVERTRVRCLAEVGVRVKVVERAARIRARYYHAQLHTRAEYVALEGVRVQVGGAACGTQVSCPQEHLKHVNHVVCRTVEVEHYETPPVGLAMAILNKSAKCKNGKKFVEGMP